MAASCSCKQLQASPIATAAVSLLNPHTAAMTSNGSVTSNTSGAGER